MDRKIKRGDLYYANLDDVIGSEQGGIRPILVIQNNVGNKYSPTIVWIGNPFLDKITPNKKLLLLQFLSC